MKFPKLFVVSYLILSQFNGVRSIPCKYIEDVIRGQEDTEGVLDDPSKTDYCTNDGYKNYELALSNSTIPILKKGAVRNMPWLIAIYCIYCYIEQIESGAFHNVNNITEFEFSYGVLTEIRRGIFNVLPKLEVLDLRGNKIYNIDDQAFSNMPVLRHLNLNGNEMEYWKREWFTNSTSIVTVKFVKNKLRSVPPLAFADFRILQNVYFDDNEITHIHRDAFKGVTYMFNLGLSNNRLITLSPRIFPNKITIEIFDVSGNLLNFLPVEMLKKLKVDQIFIEGNPWKCQCLNQIDFWLNFIGGKTGYNNFHPECNSPNIPICVVSVASGCLESVESSIAKTYFANEEVQKRKNNRQCTKGYYALFYGDNI